MAPKLNYYQLSPLVLNQAAPVAPTLTARFDSPPTSVKLHLDALGTDLPLTPDATGTLFTAVVPTAALTTGFTAANVNRKFIGHLMVTTGAEVDQYNVFGDVLTASIPTVAVHPVSANLQRSDNLVNLHFPSLAEDFGTAYTQVAAMTQAFFAQFPDDYDFVHVILGRSYIANRLGFCHA